MSARTQERTHFVLVRETGMRRYRFLTPKGEVTGLRIHAARYTAADAESLAAEINAENAGEWEAEARPA